MKFAKLSKASHELRSQIALVFNLCFLALGLTALLLHWLGPKSLHLVEARNYDPSRQYLELILVTLFGIILTKKGHYRAALIWISFLSTLGGMEWILANPQSGNIVRQGQFFCIRGIALSLVSPAQDMFAIGAMTIIPYSALIFILKHNLLKYIYVNMVTFTVAIITSGYGSALRDKKSEEIEEQKSRIQAMINSTTYGFATVDKAGRIQPGFSETIQEFLGHEVQGKEIADLLSLKSEEVQQLIQVLTQGQVDLVPKSLLVRECQVGERILQSEFSPVLFQGEINQVLVTLNDITDTKALERKNENLKAINSMIVKILKNKPLFKEVMVSLGALREVLGEKVRLQTALHTLKGEFGFFGFSDCVSFCHEWEVLLKKEPPPQNPIYYEKLKTLVSNLLETHKDILNLESSQTTEKEDLLFQIEKLEKVFKKHKETGLSDPLAAKLLGIFEKKPEEWFSWLNEVWLMTAKNLGKEVNPIEWEDSVEILPELYSPLFRSLIHVARNSIDHGIELPEERELKKKPRKGKMTASIQSSGDQYLLKMRDDGRGVNLDRIKEIAQTRGISSTGKSDDQVLEFLFLTDFTSQSSATEISGNGVGLSAVKEEAIRAGGNAKLTNHPGLGLEIQVSFKKQPLEALWNS